METIEISQPDDFHHHLRDEPVLGDVVAHAERSFEYCIAMPNLKPPVRTVEDARQYHARILSHVKNQNFKPLMTLYLTDNTKPEEILLAKDSGIVHAVKYYPSGATTNSEFGVTSLEKVSEVLSTMEQCEMPLLIHGEVTDPAVDVFDREKVFLETILQEITNKFPNLRIVLEHITTEDSVNFVLQANSNVAATITAHHLLHNRSDIFRGGICPHMYCLPILKREKHRQALLNAATSGNPKFFAGTDSAPHALEAKESSCGCAGIFTAHAAVELYAEAFESVNALDKLSNFVGRFGREFYRLPIQENNKITLRKESWTVPELYNFGGSHVKPLRAGQIVNWKISSE